MQSLDVVSHPLTLNYVDIAEQEYLSKKEYVVIVMK